MHKTELIYLKDIERVANSVVTVGTFDGVHEGHKSLINTVVEKAKKRDARSVVISFDPHPRDIINPGTAGIKQLTTIRERREILEDIGIDVLLIIPFDRDFSLLSSEEFVKNIVFEKIGVSEFVIGYDHHFGKDRSGSIETIENLGKELGFEAYIVSKKEMGDITVSSTLIRKVLAADGDVQLASSLLGRSYLLNGIVIHGDKRGRSIGFPTANLKAEHPNKVIPKDGVYAVRVRVADVWYQGMMNIGNRPTFEGASKALEVNIFEFDEVIYGQTIQVRFMQRLRGEKKFSGIDGLVEQLKQDQKDALSIFSTLDQ